MHDMISNPLVSIVICTYNRADLLKIVLESLTCQEVDPALFEILVIDNNSNDKTREVTLSFTEKFHTLRYVLETNQGLSYARNRGWQEAKGDYVGYIDDDGKASPEWLKSAIDIIQDVASEVFGGGYYAFYNTSKPAWFKDIYGSHDCGDEAHYLDEGEYLTGGNLFIKRSIFNLAGGFDTTLGMSGSKMSYGEETAFLKHLKSSFPSVRIYYSPKVFIYHLVRPEKMRVSWFLRNQFTSGRYTFVVQKPFMNGNQSCRNLFVSLVKIIFSLFSSTLKIPVRNRVQYPYIQNYLVEVVFRNFYRLGSWYEQVAARLQLSSE